MRKTRKDGIITILGDFNAKVGEGEHGSAVSRYGLGERNERGDRLVEFAKQHEIIICNTIFKNHKRRLYTWKSPRDMVRNQIDYIMVNKRYRNSILKCHTYPSADCNSDHVTLAAKCRIRLQKCSKNNEKKKSRINISPLKDREVAQKFAKEVEKEVGNINTDEEEIENVWRKWKEGVINAAKTTIPEKKTARRKQWMTEDIMELINERRELKNKNENDYRRVNKIISQKCREEKNRWFEEKCRQVEKLEEEGKIREMHSEIKQMMKT